VTVRFRQSDVQGARLMNVHFRLFDDGVGFRYELPHQPSLKTMRIADETTEFDVASKGTAWWIPGGEWNRYEQVYQETPIEAVSTAHTPITSGRHCRNSAVNEPAAAPALPPATSYPPLESPRR
jgi:alpha-glucosidase